jgi:ribulose-phosphate 3-epimerase
VLDFVLLMTVEPGYAGQQLVPFAFEKIEAMKALALELKPELEIEVDGNVSFEHAPKMVERGAEILVGGSSSLFAEGLTIGEGCARLRAAVA